VPLQELKAKTLQQYATQIRSLARVAYRKSSRPQACAVCGNNAHYEVCHIKPISGFLPTDFIADVNDLNNLVACASTSIENSTTDGGALLRLLPPQQTNPNDWIKAKGCFRFENSLFVIC